MGGGGGVRGWEKDQECSRLVGGGEDAGLRLLAGPPEPSGPSASPQTLKGVGRWGQVAKAGGMGGTISCHIQRGRDSLSLE